MLSIRKDKSMTDSTRWKSIMVTPDTHSKIRDLSSIHRLPISQVLTYLVNKAWDDAFERKAYVPPSKSNFKSKA
jgi:hypothetical protein